jgi:photosystem II stability/assembly factor-like uncharacterized protein
LVEIHQGADGALFTVDFHGAIYRVSADGGAYDGAWQDVSIPGLEGATATLAVDPASPGVVYAGFYLGVYKSTTGGDAWTFLEGFPLSEVPGDPTAHLGAGDLTFDAAGSTLWAATFRGVFRSADGGDTWQPASGGLAGDARDVRALVAVPGAPGRLYAATDAGIYTTTNGGDSWTQAGPGPGFVRALVVDPTDPDRLWALLFGPLQVSEDGGASWHTVVGLPDPIHSVAADPSGSGLVYAGSDLGVHRSADGGQTWQLANDELLAHNVVALDGRPDTGGRLLAASFDGPLFRSADGGATWSSALDGEFNGVASSPADPATGYAIDDHAVFRSLDGGVSWQTVSGFEYFLSGLWVAPDDPETAFVGAQFSILFSEDPTYLLRTDDGGATWDAVWGSVESYTYDVEFGPGGSGEPRIVLASAWPSPFDTGLLRSRDGGVTWEEADRAGLPDDALIDLAADPGVPGRFLGSVFEGGLFESTDAGDSWHPYGTGLPAGASARLLFDPVHPATIYAATLDDGVFRSDDRGATWQRLGSSPADRLSGAFDLAVTGDPPRLFAGTDRGVWVAGADTSPCVPDDVTLCLNGGRFEARVGWQDFQGGAGPGHAVPLTGDTGAFWFFRDTNLELAVKVLDGRAANGFWWVFYGSLSNVPFTLVVRNTENGDVRHYDNPPRRFASRGDTRGFPAPLPAGGSPRAAGPPAAAVTASGLAALPATSGLVALSAGGSVPPDPPPCAAGPTVLCLNGGRFRVEVAWEDFQGGSGAGHAHPLTDDTGAFWFFRETNLELFVKVLDGRTVNDHWWVFYGSLSNVPFTLTVTDTATGTPRTYQNPPRTFASRGDTTAF